MSTIGKFIAFYGTNNKGKSIQRDMLVQKIISTNRLAEGYKYPIYFLKPSGPSINDYLRNGNPHKFTAREIQLLYVENRTHFQPWVFD